MRIASYAELSRGAKYQRRKLAKEKDELRATVGKAYKMPMPTYLTTRALHCLDDVLTLNHSRVEQVFAMDEKAFLRYPNIGNKTSKLIMRFISERKPK